MKHKLKLLSLISYKFLPAHTGGEIAHLHFHNHIASHADNYVIGVESNDELKSNIKFNLIKSFKNRILTYLQFPYLVLVAKTIKKEKIDIVMCSHPYLGLLCYLATRITGSRMISYSHNIESERFKTLGEWWSPILFYYEKWVLQVSNLTFFVTEEDRQWAILNYKLSKNQTQVSPFGINLKSTPIKDPKYKDDLQVKFGLTEDIKILYFIGTFPYEPNNQAVDFILNEINPRLENSDLNYRIFIAGKNLDESRQKTINAQRNIIYLGFVDDIREVLDSADLMLNPMLLGGGIKTKAVEALGHNIKVVSTANGSFGLDPIACQDMLYTSADYDWDQFVSDIHISIESKSDISTKFYENYYWGNVTKRVVESLEKL